MAFTPEEIKEARRIAEANRTRFNTGRPTTTTTPTATTEGADSEFNYTSDEVADKVVSRLKVTKYSTSEPEDYNFVRRSFADQYGFTRVSDLTPRVNSLAELWKKENNGVYPSATELYQWDVAHNSIGTFAAGYSRLSPSFTIVQPDGTWTRYHNDPIRGPSAAANQDTPDFELLKTGVRSQHGDVIPESDLQNILAGLSPISQPSGGGGGGGTARDPLVFDRRQLESAALDRWRGRLLEEPEDDVISQVVSDYIGKANAFWMQESGRLDFDTFVVDRIEGTDRSHFLYERKPEFQSHEEYIGGFRSATAKFGINNTATLREIEAGAHAGVGAAGFQERVSKTREARNVDGGGFSRNLANQMAQMGAMG